MDVSSGDSSWLLRLRGRFLVFDGPDGSGKSTALKRFGALARAAGLTVTEARDPGGTPVGERIREILLDPIHAEMTVRTEMLLYMASRAQLVDEMIRPALARGELVLGDRFVSSTLAYQGAAGGMPEADILHAAEVACAGTWPDLTVILDVDEAAAARRLGMLLDRMEAKGAAFHRKVRAGYLAQTRRWPERHLVVDASKDVEGVWSDLIGGVERWATRPKP
ncbi:MAG: dTMP kinase [Phycisphaerales bacterium]|nr:dTMP kinase [Phycisphaerales bacterium]